jgi:hypothetical protein
MVRHADHHDGIDLAVRTNRGLMLTLLWVGLAACVISSVVYDVGHWLSAW